MSKAATTKATRGRKAAQATASKAASTKMAGKAMAKTKPKSEPATTIYKLVWRDVVCRVRHTPNYLSKGWSHIEIIVVKPKGAPLPITDTGYRSHFLDSDVLSMAGGPVAFFMDWIEREAATKQWSKTDFKWRQGDLFA